MVHTVFASPAELTRRAAALARPPQRRILGLTGPPGAGKSTLAHEIAQAMGESAVLVPMDGFHLANQVLADLGRSERKGAIDTFDSAGYLAMLRRLRARDEPVVYAPQFHREVEESYAAAIAVPADVPLVITEGNYLLADQPPWPQIRSQIDEVWYVHLAQPQRLARLVARHRRYGKSADDAQAWACGPDQLNAEAIEGTMDRADLILTVR